MKLRQVFPQFGNTDGGLFRDVETEDFFYLKFARTERHALNERLASRLYGLAGVWAVSPEFVLINGRICLISKFIPGITDIQQTARFLEQYQGARLAHIIEKLNSDAYAGYAVDCWLANWDAAIGSNLGFYQSQKPIRLDLGGSLLFRARGEEKRDRFTDEIFELATMRSGIFSEIKDSHIRDSAGKVIGLSDKNIIETVKDSGFQCRDIDCLIEKLLRRKKWISNKYKGL